MGDRQAARDALQGDGELERSRTRDASGRTPSGALPAGAAHAEAAHAGLPVAALLGLQRAAGNAAVVQLLRGSGPPAAPEPPSWRPEEREEAAGPLEVAPAPDELVGNVPALEEGERPTRAERAEKRAEGDVSMPVAEEDVAIGGGGLPVSGAAPAVGAGPAAGSFVDGGRADTIPFGDAEEHGLDAVGGDLDPGTEDLRPRIFVAGGRTGNVAWGGGAGAGPHGNQESGSAEIVKPEIETSWGGVFTNADAWVKEGTGTVTVKRDYVSSSPGDQGNGWYVTDKAAAGLERHEQRHVSQSRSVYADKIQPMLDRILNSYTYGKGKVYKSVDAAALVQRYVDWASSVKGFDEDDKAWNGKGGQVD